MYDSIQAKAALDEVQYFLWAANEEHDVKDESNVDWDSTAMPVPDLVGKLDFIDILMPIF